MRTTVTQPVFDRLLKEGLEGFDVVSSKRDLTTTREKNVFGGNFYEVIVPGKLSVPTVVAIYLLRYLGARVGLRISSVLLFNYVDQDRFAEVQSIQTTEDMQRSSKIPISIGQGVFSSPTKPNRSDSLTLRVAHALGIVKDKSLEEFLEPVFRHLVTWSHEVEIGTAAKKRSFYAHERFRGLEHLIRMYDLANLNNPQKVYDTLEDILDSVVAYIMAEHKAEAELYNVRKDKFNTGNGVYEIAYVTSDYTTILGAIRRRLKPNVIVIQNSNNHVVVSCGAQLSLKNVVSLLRVSEYKNHGGPIIQPEKLSNLGLAHEQDRWFYKEHPSGNLIINGGFTAPHVPSTGLDIFTIRDLIIEGLKLGSEGV